ncbi:MAG TPA: glycosyltransferase family 4 protein [Dissulfurispiraceae bacterium]|nr:glycosyltransferase family 4 protein [Dissulfurispiraceae bacterium]
MKILLVHNFYGSAAPSGENAAYEAERDLLKSHGHTVTEFTRHSDDIRKKGFAGEIAGALSTPWNPFSYRRLKAIVKREPPDVMHVHNFFPLISPSVFYAIQNTKTAAVFTLHNYRIFCAAAIPMREDKICTECFDTHSVCPAMKHGCYRDSRAATLPMVAMIALHRNLGTWTRRVDGFIALTEFQRHMLAQAGLPVEKIYVKPHFYPDAPGPVPWAERENKVVYIGRLGREKGVEVLLKAWKLLGGAAPHLEIIGDGPEKERLIASLDLSSENRITFTGQLPFAEAQKRLAGASALILPSLCFEGFPMVIREAFALGVPVMASRIGAIPEIVMDGKNGVLFEAGNAGEMQSIVVQAFKNRDKLQFMSINARQDFEHKYTAEKNLEALINIYQKAIAHKRGKSASA